MTEKTLPEVDIYFTKTVDMSKQRVYADKFKDSTVYIVYNPLHLDYAQCEEYSWLKGLVVGINTRRYFHPRDIEAWDTYVIGRVVAIESFKYGGVRYQGDTIGLVIDKLGEKKWSTPFGQDLVRIEDGTVGMKEHGKISRVGIKYLVDDKHVNRENKEESNE